MSLVYETIVDRTVVTLFAGRYEGIWRLREWGELNRWRIVCSCGECNRQWTTSNNNVYTIHKYMDAYEKWINLRIHKWDRLIKKKKRSLWYHCHHCLSCLFDFIYCFKFLSLHNCSLISLYCYNFFSSFFFKGGTSFI